MGKQPFSYISDEIVNCHNHWGQFGNICQKLKCLLYPSIQLDFQGIHPEDSINKVCSEIVPSVWNLWRGQKRSLLTVWEGSIYHIHTMDLLKSARAPLSHSIWHLAQHNANYNSEHLFIFLTPFRSRGKAPHFLPCAFKLKGNSNQIC